MKIDAGKTFISGPGKNQNPSVPCRFVWNAAGQRSHMGQTGQALAQPCRVTLGLGLRDRVVESSQMWQPSSRHFKAVVARYGYT